MICALDQAVLTVRDIEGNAPRSGTVGPIDSFCFREPDLNLVGVSACRAAGGA